MAALKEEIGCSACKGSAWEEALDSLWTWAKALCCADEKIPEMERAGSMEPFFMRPLRCCVEADEVPGVEPCAQCLFSDRLPLGTCPCFTDMERLVTWLKRQDTIEGANSDKIVVRLRSYTGPFRELLESAKVSAKPYLHHLWGARFLRRQFHLDCDFFLPLYEAVLLVDFASAMVS